MKLSALFRILPIVGTAVIASSAFAQQAVPKIAVTDLAYSQTVAEYFEAATVKSTSNVHANKSTLTTDSQTTGSYVAGTHNYIDHRELGSFSNDIKGALLRGTTFRLVQGKRFDSGEPQPTKAEQALNQLQTGKIAKPVKQPDVKDIIARIKKGEFPGADYVLFGVLSNVEFRNELSPLQGTSSTTRQFALDLLADFSLINTKTYEIKAAFSAQGAGSETKIFSGRGDVIPPNRSKIMRETSQTLAKNVYEQLVDQLALSDPAMGSRVRPQMGSGGAYASPQAAQPATEQVQVLK
jgi:hypothetical protein